jgi:TolB protein
MKLFQLFQLITCLLLIMLTSKCTDEKITPHGSGIIDGKVLYEKDLSPVANVEVYTNPQSHMVITDSTGSFLLENVTAGDYTLIARKREYFTYTTTLKVNVNSNIQVVIKLDQRPEETVIPVFSGSFFPTSNQNNISVSTHISWQLEKLPDDVDFRLKLYESGHSSPYIKKEVRDTFAIVNGLKFGTTYWWQVTAESSFGLVHSDVQTFSTSPFPHDFLLYAKKVDGISQIFVSDLEFGPDVRITYNNFHSWRPVANPQGNKIAFISTREIGPQLYTMGLNGGEIRRVTNIPLGGFYNKSVGFSWLPGGEELVFTAYNSLYVINHDGTGLRHLTSLPETRHFRDVDWSPVSARIVAITAGSDYYDAEVILMNTDGSGKKVLLDNVPGALGDPVFSIDGNSIIYTHDVSEYSFDPRRQLDARIFRYNLKTGEITGLSGNKQSGTNDLFPRFSPDGSRLFFVNARNTIGARKDLWMIRASGEGDGQRQELVRDVVSDDLP